MTTAYTPILKLALPVTGELNGAWGNVVNNNITSMVEQAVAGLATINTWTANSHTLTSADGTTSESRCAMLVIDDDGAGNPSAAATVICPAATKAYIVRNICGQTVTLRTSAGVGIAVPNNQAALLFCDGTNVYTGAFNGDVVGPATATNNAVVTFDGTTGKLIKDNSGVTISAGVVTGTGFTGALNGTLGATTPNTIAATTVTATQVDITAQGDLRLQDAAGGQYVALQAPATIATSYTLTFPVDDGTNGQALVTDGNGVLSWSSAASGDVYGPASATNNAIATYDGTTGKIIKDNSGTTISAGVITATGFSGPINGTIGAATPATGAFTDFTASGTASFTGTGAVKMAAGNTAQQPGTPTAGMFRFNTQTVKFEGYNGTAWGTVGGELPISNDTATSSNLYPAFLTATSGSATSLYTSNAKLLYKPSTGELQSTVLNATNGIVVNSATVAIDYTIPTGSNAMSAGPVTISSGITVTVPSDSTWVVV